MELWQLMNPAARKVKSLRRTPLEWVRRWWRTKRGECPWFAQP